jgi:ferredoxin-nitrite reductase
MMSRYAAKAGNDQRRRQGTAEWAGVFFRRQTPGHFMMRVRIPNGITSATQVRALGEISEEFGKGFADITTRQQIQLRWFTINDVPQIWRRMESAGLVSLQTGMDNIRGVIRCPAAGLTPTELFDASPVVWEFTQMFVGNREFTNLRRKFNVTITACKEACTHAETQNISLTPATQSMEVWRSKDSTSRWAANGLRRLSHGVAVET